MKKAGDLAEKVQRSGMQTCTTTSTRKYRGLPESWIAGLFKKMAIHYGNLWTSQIPTQQRTDDAMREWGEYLADIKPADLKRGMDNLPDRPPSLPAFRNLCLGKTEGLTHNTEAYRKSGRALPKPKADPDLARSELAKMRAALKAGMRR